MRRTNLEPVIPDDVRRFVLASIPSVPYLEAALLFQRAPGVAHTCADVADALYISNARAAELLEALVEAGVLAARDATEPSYEYAPRDRTLAASFDRLARIYETEVITITHLIHESTAKGSQRFADAFKPRNWR